MKPSESSTAEDDLLEGIVGNSSSRLKNLLMK